MKELIEYWRDYKIQCDLIWGKEQERTKAINEQKLKDQSGGFEFPQKTFLNTPSFEGFMDWLSYVIK